MPITKTPTNILVLSLLLFLGFSECVSAAIIHVPADHLTIQAAIDAATTGFDEVVVAPNTYSENIDLKGKAIILRSSGGAEVTTIDGGGSGSVVTCNSGETLATIIEGFTVTDGNGTIQGTSRTGGGILIDNADPTVRNCILLTNQADQGAGIWMNQSDALIERCRFEGNLAQTQLVIAQGFGAGVYVVNSSPVIHNCLFVGNEALFDGSGVFVISNLQMSRPEIINCTFAQNVESVIYTKPKDQLGVIDSFPVVFNCIIWDNNATSINLVNTAVNHCITETIVLGGSGNSTQNPLFLDPDGPDDNPSSFGDNDYRLSCGSPAIDGGGNAAVPGGVTVDFAGQPRFTDDPFSTDCEIDPGTCGTSPIVDIGALEFIPSCLGDVNRDQVVGLTDVLELADAWLASNCSEADNHWCGKVDIDLSGNIDLFDAATFFINFGNCPD
jgi:hypothetical protein